MKTNYSTKKIVGWQLSRQNVKRQNKIKLINFSRKKFQFRKLKKEPVGTRSPDIWGTQSPDIFQRQLPYIQTKCDELTADF